MVCSVIGHNNIEITSELKINVKKTIEELIVKFNTCEFLFGSKSKFNDLCYEIVTELKLNFHNLKRIYVRAEYPNVNEAYLHYLSEFYEETYFYDKALKSNTYSYIKRNKLMIDKSDVCLFYYNANYCLSGKRKSGTKTAFEYAVKKNKKVINLFCGL